MTNKTCFVTVLMFVLWYCHKRGREVRLEKERSAAVPDMGGRVEELSDTDSAIGSATATPLPLEGCAAPALIEDSGARSRRRK